MICYFFPWIFNSLYNNFWELVKNSSVIVASFTAIYGINTWKRQDKWKKKNDLCSEVLLGFYQAEESIRKIRNPWSSHDESKDRVKNSNETPNQARIYDIAFAVSQRYEENRDIFNNLRKLKHKFRAMFGKDNVHTFEEIDSIINSVFSATRALALMSNRNNPVLSQEEINATEKYEGIIWEYLENDIINQRLTASIKKIEEFCVKHIN